MTTTIKELPPLQFLKPTWRQFRDIISINTLQIEALYRLYLKLKWGANKPTGLPDAPWNNAVLKTFTERDKSVEQVKKLGLNIFDDLPKNWDSLAALDIILKKFDKNAVILDAGAELYSKILPWLYLYGYRNLQGINLIFDRKIKRGPITYKYGDITQTEFDDNTFDAITCLSVIEHGVDLTAYFKEMSRILKPGGILITSTDYYDKPIDTKNQIAFGVPVHIFNKNEILQSFKIAEQFHLSLTGDIDLDCQEKVVDWPECSLKFTFVIFTLSKQ